MNTTGSHERFERDEQVKGSTDRMFGIVFAVVFALIGLWPILSGDGMRLWSLAVGAAFLLVAFVRPALLGPLNRLWTRFGMLLHRVTNPLIMGLVFYLAVTPTALILRLAGKDPLRRRIEPNAKTYWIDREPPGPAPETMKRQF